MSSPSSSSVPSTLLFDRDRQIGYFAYSLRQLPGAYCKLDTNRLTLVHFAVHALDMLGIWDLPDSVQKERLGLNRLEIIEWIYSLQTTTTKTTSTTTTSDDDNSILVGFKGGGFLGTPPPANYNHGHIAMTYTALATLKTLGDDLSGVDKQGIVSAMKHLQLADGSFQCVAVGSEHDMRFLYCACAISHMLNDWSGVDVEKAVEYIQLCHSWDGAFALLPGQEGHGGSTFCAVASLVLMRKLEEILDNDSKWRDDLIHWCTSRQVGGMQGRPGKLEDTCYSYWIGGTLRLLGQDSLLDHQKLRSFVMTCQNSQMGGFSKVVGAFPDILHSYYSMCYLNFSQTQFSDKDDNYNIQLKPLNCTLGICQERADLFGEADFP